MLYQLSYCPILRGSPLGLPARRSHGCIPLARSFAIARCPSHLHGYFVSLCAVCLRQKRQNLLSSSRSVVFFLFFVVL